MAISLHKYYNVHINQNKTKQKPDMRKFAHQYTWTSYLHQSEKGNRKSWRIKGERKRGLSIIYKGAKII